MTIDQARAITHLSEAVQFKTETSGDFQKIDEAAFLSFLGFLESAYPKLHSQLEHTRINQYGIVFHWHGQKTAAPVLLLAHYDVVPADQDGWQYGPYSGAVVDGEIWGRGTLDDKGSLIAILEAVETLLENNFTPPRDIYLAFGFDEETHGRNGAQKIEAYFLEQGIHFAWLLDEGGVITDGAAMGLKQDIAVIGIAEKGNCNYRFTFKGKEGHSSAPPQSTSIGKMAAFIKDVESHPRKVRLTDTVIYMLKAIAPYKSTIQQTALNNPKLFFPLIKSQMLANKQTAAMLRTTVSFTMTQSGSAPNVLPLEASCVANVRILQGESSQQIEQWFSSFGHDFELEAIGIDEPTRISSIDTAAFQHIKQTITNVYPQAVPTPYLMVGGTDARNYQQVSDHIYRFLPCYLSSDELDLMHSRNERITVEKYIRMISFYMELLRGMKGDEDEF